jgi:DNA-binding NtrC family response regulator
MSLQAAIVPARKPSGLRLLLVCRESAVVGPLWAAGESCGWELESASSGWGAIERVQAGITPDLLLLDVAPNDSDGLHFLRWLRRLRPELPILALCHSDDPFTQQEALRLGARECLSKPLREKELEEAIYRQVVRQSAGDAVTDLELTGTDIKEIEGNRFFVAASHAMRKLRAQLGLLAEIDAPVLILGEKGSGKETAARLLHQLSVRSGFKFAKVNCAALPSDLLDQELFGFERGDAGPLQAKRGLLELCDKGTILLDEIGEMPLSLQSKLMQVMQGRRFPRPGSGASVGVDVRILASSAEALESAVADNKLREDLYHRLSTYTVRVPSMRERREELPLLLHQFMQSLARQYALAPRPLSPAVLEVCQAHHWPGNLRELESFVKRLLLAAGPQPGSITEEPQSIAARVTPLTREQTSVLGHFDAERNSSRLESLKSLVQTVKLEAERNAIASALEQTGWNRKAAARLLKVSYRTLLYKIEQYRMRAPGAGRPGGFDRIET